MKPSGCIINNAMKTKLLALLLALLTLCASAMAERYAIDPQNQDNFGNLLIDLLHAYEQPEADDAKALSEALDAIQQVSGTDYALAKSIADHWSRVYLNAEGEYALRLHRGEQTATALEQTGMKDSAAHAFVVLGFELKNGRMTEELIGRCDAAAAAARSFPSAILVCSGGPTGKNNPDRNTEAGLMKRYLVERCGIDAGRVFIDEKTMNTVENAVNCFEIMRAQGVETFTVVTSSYHQRWGQAIYNAMAELYRLGEGYDARIVENYCYPIEARGNYKRDDRFAIRQLTQVLGLSDGAVERMKKLY